MREALSGDAAAAAIGKIQQLVENFQYTQAECGLISAALNGFSHDIEAAKKKLDAAIADAEANKLTVNPDGSVSYPAGGKPSARAPAPGGKTSGQTDPTAQALNRQAANFDPNPGFRLAQECADRIAAALKEATEADTKWAPKIQALTADDDLTVSARDWADAESDTQGVAEVADEYLHSLAPPERGTPQQNADWWKSLSAEDRSAYLSVHPDTIGALNGLPADVRDEANRSILTEKRAQDQVELDSIPPEPTNKYTYITAGGYASKVYTDEWMEWNKKYADRKAQLTDSVKAMGQIQMRYDTFNGDPTVRPYLLGFDDKKPGHVIMSIGNPGTADNVTTYVPGTGAKLTEIDGAIRRAEQLQTKAASTDPLHSTASIMWLGYDAPQDVMGDAMDPAFADAAKDPLSDFLTGVDTAHGGNVNSTVLGHSYGSLVAGEALRDHPELPVDNAIMVGSPGLGVNHAKDLNIPADHVWAATAKNDLINLAPPPSGALAPLNPKAYMHLFDDHSILYGYDPTSDDFGGQTFHVADGKAPGSDGFMPAHSQYWEGESLANMATIATEGKP
ncbi:alpha/beta hydrolase family protein [Streptomyces sp. ASQP_92]|uniref:alpha/beta hydrolase family protein n=1 Tax=Streptomyces sp. ASQP_92 TaxID=2979116 RepID=UPI0021BFE896|nr:alpha/beta hydrolase family protein [Streptomyces sp. ASQP_92]MCT9087636.1 alpha/beta hydrolase family protein [Streptomyces sp. ASQP_92]